MLNVKNRSKVCFKTFFTGSKVLYTATVGNSSVANGALENVYANLELVTPLCNNTILEVGWRKLVVSSE